MSTEQGNPQGSADTTTETTSTVETEVKETSLRDSLEAEYEIQEKGPESNELSEAAKKLAGARKGGAKADEQKRAQQDAAARQEADAKTKREAELAKLEPEEREKALAEDKRKADEVTKAAEEAKSLEAPAHWPAADREMFAKQAPEAKKWLLNRHKAMESDYTKKLQEITPLRRLHEEMEEIFKPHDAEMRQLGVTRAQAIRELVGIHERLKANPVEGLKYIAQISKVDLKSLVEGAAAADPAGESPTVKALRAELSELKTWKHQLTGQQSEQQMNANMSQVQQFAEEKDAQGQPKHPYFDDVAADVARLIRAAKQGGETLSLQDAYDQALYANPTTRAKVLAAQDAQRKAKEEAERKAKADAAKKAGFDVRGEGAAHSGAATTTTIRDSLEAAWNAQEGRV